RNDVIHFEAIRSRAAIGAARAVLGTHSLPVPLRHLKDPGRRHPRPSCVIERAARLSDCLAVPGSPVAGIASPGAEPPGRPRAPHGLPALLAESLRTLGAMPPVLVLQAAFLGAEQASRIAARHPGATLLAGAVGGVELPVSGLATVGRAEPSRSILRAHEQIATGLALYGNLALGAILSLAPLHLNAIIGRNLAWLGAVCLIRSARGEVLAAPSARLLGCHQSRHRRRLHLHTREGQLPLSAFLYSAMIATSGDSLGASLEIGRAHV